jgi:8-oxo-dGTP diphosphatase
MDIKRTYPSAPLVGAGCVIHRGGKVLLVRRKNPPHADNWSIPGGLVELGERVEDAAAREALEETGLSVKVERLLDVGSDISVRSGSRPEYHYILVDYVARPLRGRVVLNAESSDYGWFSERDIPRLTMSDGTRAALAKYFLQRPR